MATISPGVSRVIIIAWACLLSLPFIHQPLHLDDCFYFDIAENALKKPLFPQDMPYVFEGERFQDLASNSHAPLVSYYIALAKIILPDRLGEEARLHLAFAVFPMIIGLAGYSLARAFSPYPLLAAMLIQATPVVMVNSHTLMSDVPALAFWLLALAGFHRWFTEREKRFFVLCLVSTILACFAAYQSLSLVLLFALYAWLKKRVDRWIVLVCALPIAFVLASFAVGYAHYGRFLLAYTATYASGRGIFTSHHISERGVAILGFIGGTTLFPLGYLLVYARWLRGRVIAVMFLASLVIVQVFAPDYALGEKALLALLLSAALVLSTRILLSGISAWARQENRDADDVFIAAWFALVFLYCIVIFYTSAARYILPLVPPLVIFFSREVHRWFSAGRVILIGLLAATSVQAAALSVSDLQFAGIYPQMAARAELLSRRLPGRVWYGGEWGFRHYMDREHLNLIDSDMGAPPVRGGDLILLPELASPYNLAPDLQSMLVKVEEQHYTPGWSLRLLDRRSNAGFHSVHWGLLPFSFSSTGLECLTVYQVSLLSEKLPDASASGSPLPYPAFVERGGERKLALIGGIPMRISYGLRLPRNGKMIFGIAALAENLRDNLAQPVEFSVKINTGAGISTPVFRHVLTRTMTDKRFTVDLSRFPAGDAAVEFETTAKGELEKGARSAWIDFCVIP